MVPFMILQHILVQFARVELVLQVSGGWHKEGLVRWQVHTAQLNHFLMLCDQVFLAASVAA